MPLRESNKSDVSNTSFVGSVTGSIGGIRPSSAEVQDESSYFAIVKEAFVRGTPLGVAALAQFSISTVLVAMVGKMVGVEELGATSLAFGLINASAYSFAAGFSGALETVLSYSYGRDPTSKLYGVYAQRMALLLLIVSACLGPVLAFADMFLNAIGQNPAVTHFTGIFCRIALFAIYPTMLLEILRRYFACQHLSNPLSVNLIISACAFPFILWVLIKSFGYVGAPIGWLILMVCMPASLFLYLVKTKKYKKTWGGWDTAALHNWGPLLRLAFPSLAMMLSEWASLEVNAITAGFAPPEHLAAYSVMYLTSGILWSLTSGLFIEAAVLVGNALGQGKWRLARRCAMVSLVMSAVHALINLTVLYFLRRIVAGAFSNDENVTELYMRLFPFFCVYHVFDCIQSCMMGVLRGCGKQVVGSIAIALVYSVVGVPLGIILFFTTDLSVRALWIGPGVGVSCVGFPLYMWMLFRYIKWDQIVVADDDVPSLHSSLDRRSMLSRPPSTPSLSEAADENDEDRFASGEGTSSPSPSPTPGMGTRRSSTLGLDPQTPLEKSGTLPDNASFASHFHIPGRNILITPAMPPATATPILSAARPGTHRSAPPSMGASPDQHPGPHDGFLLSSPAGEAPSSLPAPEDATRDGGSSEGSDAAAPHRPPSSRSSEPSSLREDPHTRSSSSSSRSYSRATQAQGQQLSTRPSTPPGET